MATNGTTDGDAVHLRQHQIENNEVEGFSLDLSNRFVAGRGLGDGQPFEAEMESDKLANVRFVLDDEGATPNDTRTRGSLMVGHVRHSVRSVLLDGHSEAPRCDKCVA